MHLQRFSPAPGRSWKIANWAIIALFVLIVLSVEGPVTAYAAGNGGLGPLSIRNQFPVTLGFLTYTPESPITLPVDTFQVRYQYSITNSFINTQSPTNPTGPYIDRTAVSRAGGLVASDFNGTGYGLYLDMEASRHQFRFAYALSESFEISLELSWIGLDGGTLDGDIENVEDFFNGLNEDRLTADRDRFDFYIIRDGVFLAQSTQSFASEAMDPVLNLKWTLSEGGDVLPAFAFKLSYKQPLDTAPTGSRALISSGGKDWGYYFLFGKEIGDVIAHLQIGTTHLTVAPNTFSEKLKHKMFGLEFIIDEENSFIMQSVTQSSIFPESNIQTNIDYALSSPTDVFIIGIKHLTKGFIYELGLIEDYNQQRNEADITFYLELGWDW